jgi:hypothetical protein
MPTKTNHTELAISALHLFKAKTVDSNIHLLQGINVLALLFSYSISLNGTIAPALPDNIGMNN